MKKTTQFLGRVFATSVACLFAMATSSNAVITYHEGYNGGSSFAADAAAFASAQVSPTGLSEGFSSPPYATGDTLGAIGTAINPLTLSGGSPTYKANVYATPTSWGLWVALDADASSASRAITTDYGTDSIVMTFAGGASVTAVGATFFLSDASGNPQVGHFSVTAFDGTSSVTRDYANSGPVFLGFTSDGDAFESLTLSRPSGSGWVTFDNLQVGAAVPEASTLIGAGFLGLLLCWQTGRNWVT
jgi:hypothetical protein